MADTKIAILTLYDDAFLALAARTLPNKAAYARRHGYRLITETQPLDAKRPTSWSKIPALLKHLATAEWLFWSDIDAFFTDFTRPLEGFTCPADLILPLSPNRARQYGWPARNPNEPQINASHFFMRNCEWSRAFLSDVYAQTQFLHHPWWEQKAMMHLLENEPRYQTHVHLHPVRLLFSGFPDWQRGDFAIHFGAGRKRRKMEDWASRQDAADLREWCVDTDSW
jgi:mannan polymerase II complex MNN10 subunit